MKIHLREEIFIKCYEFLNFNLLLDFFSYIYKLVLILLEIENEKISFCTSKTYQVTTL